MTSAEKDNIWSDDEFRVIIEQHNMNQNLLPNGNCYRNTLQKSNDYGSGYDNSFKTFKHALGYASEYHYIL
ncbi:unnamed protein product [Adineta steineri]|uniref:Uncharacterized protein n=1 Tax=Adineta steineri TaxID=433720 RepID=A0A815MAZ2_9BILA|nr:unnamed protein product [Adineta steineri]CAF1621247.1 unnamed protein product [Adineta steineri]